MLFAVMSASSLVTLLVVVLVAVFARRAKLLMVVALRAGKLLFWPVRLC